MDELDLITIQYEVITSKLIYDNCKTMEDARKIAHYIKENENTDVIIREVKSYWYNKK